MPSKRLFRSSVPGGNPLLEEEGWTRHQTNVRTSPTGWSTSESGFTLIEVMVTLTIMALVMTVAFAGLRIGINGWQRGQKAIDDLDHRAVVERLIQRQLAVAVPVQVSKVVMFRGSAARVEFISDYSLVDGPTDFRKIDYAANGGSFLYGEKPLFEYEPSENEEPPQRALAAFGRVSFSFLGKDTAGKPEWQNEWKLGMGVPAAVQVHLDDDTFVVRMVNR